MTETRNLKLGFQIPARGQNKWDWRYTEAPGDASFNFDYYRSLAEKAEAAKIDFLFMNDGVVVDRNSPTHFLARFEPLTVLSGLAALTSHIGLVATVNCSFSDPFNVARQFASLDVMSGGRAGWNVVTGDVAEAALNFSDRPYLDHDERYRMAAEHLDVVRRLWDSWEDDAFLFDKERKLFADTTKLHTLNHKGPFFSVRGPLPIPRSPQGQPVIFQAGISEMGRDFAGRFGEGIFSIAPTFDDAKAYRDDLHRRAAESGRASKKPLIFPATGTIIGSSADEALSKASAYANRPDLQEALDFLAMPFLYDFTSHDPDAPFPDLPDTAGNANRGFTQMVKRVARENGWTLRQTAMRFSAPPASIVGTPDSVADQMQQWFEGGAVDGFMLGATGAEEFLIFVDEVLPILRRRGLFRAEYHHTTLRGHLGLDFPVNRYATDRG
jgi:FMN-dependent oxidoreductase (nitrilotriacetate monooxygenase family)